MKHLSALEDLLRLVLGSRAGMVHHHAPSLGCLVVHVCGQYIGVGWALRGGHFNLFHDAVDRAGHGIDAANVLWPDLQRSAVSKHGFKGRPDRMGAHNARTARVHAHNVFVVGPAGHQSLQVPRLQGVVKRGFDVIGFAAVKGCVFSGFWHLRTALERCRILPCLGICPCPLVGRRSAPMYAHGLLTSEGTMKKWILAFLAGMALSGCGYNDFQRLDEQTKSAWSEVLNQYQRRADLVPNIVATVKGEAAFEQETLTKVIEARAKATSIQVTPETLNNPEAFKKFQAAQGDLGSALSRLMVVSEQYPNLKANQGFSDLRVQLEGTENRITVARNRYIQAVQEYNVLARSFPSNLTAMVFSYQPKPAFAVQNEAAISAPPVVDFNKK